MPTKKPKIYEIKITNFSGGISDDIRQVSGSVFALSKHFDIFSSPNRLTPYRSTESDVATADGDGCAKVYDLRDFQLGADGKLYALGVTADGCPKVLKKADPTTGNWLSSGGSCARTAEGEGLYTRLPGCFIEWGSTPAFYFFESGTQLSKVAVSDGSYASAEASLGATIKTVAQGVVGADDNLYLFYNNRVVRVAPDGTVTDNVCQAIPSDMRITSACRYGTYIAIGCAYGTSATSAPVGRSQVYIWDMVTDTTVTDVIDWGEGALMILGNLEGRLVGVSDKFMSSALGAGKGSMVIKMWGGGTPQVVKEIVANQTVTLGRFIRNYVVKDNKLYWTASVPFNTSTSTESTYHLGIWSFGRKNKAGDYAITLDYIDENIDTSNFKINSFGNAGNYWFINHSADGSITKTNDASTYAFTSVYESQIFGNGKQNKKLIGVNITTTPLPTAGQVVLKYKINQETSWTTIFTHGTDNSLGHSAINIESSGATLPIYKEIQFRIESTGGAEITGFSFRWQELFDDLY